jgi:hypothetical protein
VSSHACPDRSALVVAGLGGSSSPLRFAVDDGAYSGAGGDTFTANSVNPTYIDTGTTRDGGDQYVGWTGSGG